MSADLSSTGREPATCPKCMGEAVRTFASSSPEGGSGEQHTDFPLANELMETAVWIARRHMDAGPHLDRIGRAVSFLRGVRTPQTIDARWLIRNDAACAAIAQYVAQYVRQESREEISALSAQVRSLRDDLAQSLSDRCREETEAFMVEQELAKLREQMNVVQSEVDDFGAFFASAGPDADVGADAITRLRCILPKVLRGESPCAWHEPAALRTQEGETNG